MFWCIERVLYIESAEYLGHMEIEQRFWLRNKNWLHMHGGFENLVQSCVFVFFIFMYEEKSYLGIYFLLLLQLSMWELAEDI